MLWSMLRIAIRRSSTLSDVWTSCSFHDCPLEQNSGYLSMELECEATKRTRLMEHQFRWLVDGPALLLEACFGNFKIPWLWEAKRSARYHEHSV